MRDRAHLVEAFALLLKKVEIVLDRKPFLPVDASPDGQAPDPEGVAAGIEDHDLAAREFRKEFLGVFDEHLVGGAHGARDGDDKDVEAFQKPRTDLLLGVPAAEGRGFVSLGVGLEFGVEIVEEGIVMGFQVGYLLFAFRGRDDGPEVVVDAEALPEFRREVARRVGEDGVGLFHIISPFQILRVRRLTRSRQLLVSSE